MIKYSFIALVIFTQSINICYAANTGQKKAQYSEAVKKCFALKSAANAAGTEATAMSKELHLMRQQITKKPHSDPQQLKTAIAQLTTQEQITKTSYHSSFLAAKAHQQAYDLLSLDDQIAYACQGIS